MREWHDIGILIGGLVAKEPPFIQIAIVLSAAFTALMILEGLRVNFIPRRTTEPDISIRPVTTTDFRSAPGNVARLPRNPKRYANIVKPHRALRPVIRRNIVKAPEKSAPLPQVASFGDGD